MKKLSLLLLPLIFIPSLYFYIHKQIEKQQSYSLVESKMISSEWLDNGLNKKSQTIFNPYGDTMFLKLSDLPNVPNEKGYNLPSIKGYEKQLNYFREHNKEKYQIAKKAILNEFFFNLFVDLENRGPSFNIITFTSVPVKQSKVEISLGGSSFKFENVYSDTSFQLEQFGIYENQMFVNFSNEMFKAFSKMKIGDLVNIKVTSSEGKVYNYGYIYNPTSKGGMYIPLMKYNKTHTHLLKPNTSQAGFDPKEWDEYSLNKETHTIFNKYGDTKFLMSTQLNTIFIPAESLDSKYNVLKKEGKEYWVARESFSALSTYMNELQLKNGEEITAINKTLISKFFIDITLNEPIDDKLTNTMNLITFSKEEYPKITKVYFIIGGEKFVLDNFYLNTPKFLGEKSKLYMNDIKVPFTNELFKALIKLKYQNKITLKLVSKEETYEYTYLYEPNEKGGLHIPLMKYEELHTKHPKREIKEVLPTPQQTTDNPLLKSDEPLPVPQSNTVSINPETEEDNSNNEEKKEVKKEKETEKKVSKKKEKKKVEKEDRESKIENSSNENETKQENIQPSESESPKTEKVISSSTETTNNVTHKEPTQHEQATPKIQTNENINSNSSSTEETL